MEIRLKESEKQIQRNKARTVVFSTAMVGSAAVGPYNTDTILTYGRVNMNIGNGYSHFTGIFRAPFAGIYYFTFFYRAGDHRVSLSLMKNNEVIVGSFDHSSEQDAADNGGNAVFMGLRQGDQVYVRLGANTNVWGDGACTTFIGCLVSSVRETATVICGLKS